MRIVVTAPALKLAARAKLRIGQLMHFGGAFAAVASVGSAVFFFVVNAYTWLKLGEWPSATIGAYLPEFRHATGWVGVQQMINTVLDIPLWIFLTFICPLFLTIIAIFGSAIYAGARRELDIMNGSSPLPTLDPLLDRPWL